MLSALLQPSQGPGLSLLFSVLISVFTQDVGIKILIGLQWICSLEYLKETKEILLFCSVIMTDL